MKVLFGFFLVLIGLNINAQPLFEIQRDADFIEIDHLEYIYIIRGSEIEKFSSEGHFLGRYANKINGIITSVDVTNPLRIVLFYSESNVLVFLDQQFSPITDPIDIYVTTNTEAVNIGSASSGGIWMYSFDTQNLVLYNSQMHKVRESQNLSDLIESQEITFIREFKQHVYMAVDSKILIFDMFGTYISSKPFNNTTYLKTVGEQISYVIGNELFAYNPISKEVIKRNYTISDGTLIKDIVSYKQRCYIVQKGKVKVLKL